MGSAAHPLGRDVWGARRITWQEARAFADLVATSVENQELVADTLAEFPAACEVRGMFFDGLVAAIRAACGRHQTDVLVELAGVPTKIAPFTLHPHRDFYKLFFLAAAELHSDDDLPHAMRRIAETFYPVFRESMLGRTMGLFMGRDPMKILTRLTEAYNISVPWNHHECVPSTGRSATWRGFVEPTGFYPAIFDGIIRGTMRSHEVAEPRVQLLDRKPDGAGQRVTFEVRW